MGEEAIVVGAGVAGLACAGALRARGLAVRVLEKSRGVGGRCATRRIEGQPVDHGLAFYHGDDPGFLDALRSVSCEAPFDWPRRVVGDGAPCQPRAFVATQRRYAFAGGVSAFPKHLARGIPVELRTRVTRIEAEREGLVVVTDAGRRHRARTLVLALPAAQAPELLRTIDPATSRELVTAIELLGGISMVRCLTVIAGYAAGVALPDWDVCYPGESDMLQLISQDSTKRPEGARPVFVMQCRPGWSAAHWEDEQRAWADAVLEAARPWCGERLGPPAWTDVQRWRHARLSGGDLLTAPPLIRLGHGCRIGVVGEAMAGGGGVEAAWLAGRRMAQRLVEEEPR